MSTYIIFPHTSIEKIRWICFLERRFPEK